ncbi:hypothetical protein SAMN02745166_03394 [Prosthecobacter debontii]|uniref:Carbohydrate family 9 binding domain-like n=2 Tax=Prosthecobacter debontii TaxID=48467 RepID=A0A1T4YIA4_9BACT|nr:Amuc_1102 family pilus-like protein [Prosthecobacter debontii]SKB01526.1 hypothetical protein SAMN02745166_03394 [Prosthecobacter debontii]
MKIHTALAILAFGVGTASAQTAAPAVKVDGGKLEIKSIQTPQFQASNVGEKRWRPKDWMEVDFSFQIKLPQSAGGRNGALDSLAVTYYIALNAQTKDGKYEVIKGAFNYVDIPASEDCHALAYVSPATLRRLLQKDGFTPSDIKAWGYEVTVGGQRIEGNSSMGKAPWWEKTESFSMNEGVMLAKTETPFGILWGDYDVSAKKQ